MTAAALWSLTYAAAIRSGASTIDARTLANDAVQQSEQGRKKWK